MSYTYLPPLPRRTRAGYILYEKPISDRSARMLIYQERRARRHAAHPNGPYICPCGDCGRQVIKWTQECCPQPWWDTPGLPQRRLEERCANHHGQCAYRDDDPYRCPGCHAIPERCTCPKHK